MSYRAKVVNFLPPHSQFYILKYIYLNILYLLNLFPRQNEKEIIHLFVHSINAHHSQGWL